MFMSFVAVVLSSGVVGGAPLCGPFSSSLLAAYQANGDPAIRGIQAAGAAWTHRIGAPDGVLLTGLSGGGTYTAGFWGAASAAYNVPTGGPIYSPVPGDNQIPFHRRDPSFAGIFMHPGEFDGTDSVSALKAQAPMVITALSVQCEDLGDFDGLQVKVMKRIGGIDSTVIPFSFVGPNPAPAVNLTPGAGQLPLVLNTGDTLWVQTNRGGTAAEDWCNVNLSYTFEGGPLAIAPVSAKPACLNGSTTLSVQALGSGLSYAWKRNGNPVTNGGRYSGATTASLGISGLQWADLQDSYECIVTSSCSGFSVNGGAGRVASLLPDFNASGLIDTPDLTALLARFGQTVTPFSTGDVNGDGVVNTSDLVTLLAVFGKSCP